MIAAVLAFAIVASLQPKVTLSPQGFIVGPLVADLVLVRVSTPEGSPFWCPEVEVVWHPEWAKSKHSEDCDPADEGTPYSYSIRGPASGAYMEPATILVTVRQGKHTYRQELSLRIQ